MGGESAIRELVGGWYRRVLADPVLVPLFGTGDPDHVDHLTAFLVEVFGGDTRYTNEFGGFPALLAAHRGLAIQDHQRRRFIELFLDEYDRQEVSDAATRDRFAGYLDFGTEVAVVNSHASTGAELHPCQEVPRWR
jgi:hemoglobin